MSKTQQQVLRPRRVPQRTCVACRSTEAKRGLVRVVRTPEGRVEIDPTGKKNGRGAYVHQARACWDAALKKGLGRALKVAIPAADLAAMQAHADSLPPAGAATAAPTTMETSRK